jgi:dTDP-4-amino-4,6-dideoxygalactose transaminase
LAFRVPFVLPREHYLRLETEIDSAIKGCLSAGDLILRKQLADFEANFARYVGTKYAVGLNSGYHALAFSLLAAGIGPGDEVITVAHTFVATVSAIVHAGAKPVLVDVGKDYNMDIDAVEKAITPRTKCILPVHLNGRVCDMDRVSAIAKKHNLVIIEDAAQAIGATFGGKRAGTFGAAGCFSFYPFKMLGALGDGGAVTTDDPKIARMCTLLRFNGEDREKREFCLHGHTALLDNIQAAVLDVKLKHLPSWIEQRRRLAKMYQEALAGVPGVILPHFEGTTYQDVYQNYVIRVPRRDALAAYLTENGVETIISWSKPMWHHPGLGLGNWNLPETEAICREVISLPLQVETTPEHVQITADLVRRFYSA